MIPANELRIGNWVQMTQREVYAEVTGTPVTWLKQITANDISFPWGDTDSINPIPLTPELLEKAGFVQSEDFDWEWTKPVSVNGKLVILLPKNWQSDPNYVLSASWQSKDEKALLWTRLKYLHQLQNYVFAVTEGEELEIKL